jgi:tRNA (adenine57-N1/adenine58-N1)-methyltransferase
VAENDIALLKQKGNDRTIPLLTKPLRAGDKIQTGRAPIATDDILGKAVRDLVSTAKGIEYRIHEPSLGEYTDLSPRLVTPVNLPFTLRVVNANCTSSRSIPKTRI